MVIRSRYDQILQLDNDLFIDDIIQYELNLFMCDVQHIRRLGGPAIKYIIEQLSGVVDISNMYFNTRIAYLDIGQRMHNLNWHCDGNERGKLFSERAPMSSIIGHVGTANAQIQYIDYDLEMRDLVFDNNSQYDDFAHKIGDLQFDTKYSVPGTFAQVYSTDIHRALLNSKPGWRMWVMGTDVINRHHVDHLNTLFRKDIQVF